MKNLTIAQRIGLACGFLCLVIAGLSGFVVQRFTSLRALSNEIITDSIPGMVYSGEIRDQQAEAELRALRLLLTASAEQRATIRREIDELNARNSQALERYEATITTPEDRRLFETLKARRAEFRQIRDDYVQLVERDHDEAARVSATRMRDAYTAYGEAGDAILRYNATVGVQRGEALAHDFGADIRIVVAVGVFAVVLGLAVAVTMILGLNRVLSHVAHSLSEGADQVAAAAAQVSGSSQSLASGASEQAASLEETSSALEEVASMSKRNGESANRAKSLSDQTRAAADRGAGKIAQMQQAMDAIKASSDEVSQIVKTIDEIAFQTNILALNAAVEAARAGEAGAGFAVVADEVRNLAQRAAASAQQTAGRIDDSVRRSDHGVTTSRDVATVLTEILESARQVDVLIGEITTASDEQTRGLEQVNQAITQMNSITQANAGSSEESAAAAEELNAQAVAQKQAVAELEALVRGRLAVAATHQPSAAVPPRRATPAVVPAPVAVPFGS